MELRIEDLGVQRYADAYARQLEVNAEVQDGAPSALLLVEHPPVITLGAGYHPENLLQSEETLADQGIEVATTDRGGDVTLHALGQLVAYPVIRLESLGKDLHRYLRLLEQAAIDTCAEFGVEAGRNPVNTGAWVGNRKICAVGIKVKRWVSLHGIALNCNTDLSLFRHIVPCGIRGEYGVTSLTRERGQETTVAEVKPVLSRAFQNLLAD